MLREWWSRTFYNVFDYDAFGFEVGDAVVGAVTHVDRFFQKRDERARGLGEPAVGGFVPVDGEVIGGIALGTGEGRFEPTLERSCGEFSDRVGAGTDGCYAEIHR